MLAILLLFLRRRMMTILLFLWRWSMAILVLMLRRRERILVIALILRRMLRGSWCWLAVVLRMVIIVIGICRLVVR